MMNPFPCTGRIFLYPLKTSENLWFSDVFRGKETDRRYEMAFKGIHRLTNTQNRCTKYNKQLLNVLKKF